MSRKSKPPPPPPAPLNALLPRSNSNARASFHGLQSDRSAALKTVDISGAADPLPSSTSAAEQPASIISSGHRKSNSLDRPVRPPWPQANESKKTSVTTAPSANEPVGQLSVSAGEFGDSGSLEQLDDADATRSSTLPRAQQRVQPPPVPSKSGVLQQRPNNLDAIEPSVAPTMVRVSMSDDSDDEEPVVEETSGSSRRSNGSKGSSGSEQRLATAPVEHRISSASIILQPAPRHQPTSPKEVSYVSVVEDNDAAYQQPPVPAAADSLPQPSAEVASASAPARPKPPVPSKPRVLESPEKDNSIIRL